MQYQYRHADEIIRPYNSTAIWIGDLSSAEDIHWLKVNNIKTVITAAEGVILKYDATIKHIHYKLQDNKNQNISKVLQEAADKIERALKNGSVLVHCGAGVSRSSTLVIGYLLKYKKMDFLSALKYTKSRRPGICPNLGFQLQLKSFQKLLKSRQLVNSVKTKNVELPDIQKPQKDRILNLTTINKFNNKNISLNRLNLNKQSLNRQNSLVVGNGIKGIRNQQNPQNYQIHSVHNRLKGGQIIKQKGLEYLKKMAMFRFGVTNTQKWRLG